MAIKRIALIGLLGLGLAACTPNLSARLEALEGNQGKIVGALNLIAACKADKPEAPQGLRADCKPQVVPQAPQAQAPLPASPK